MKQRLEQFLSAENLTRSQFADSIGVARAAISHIMAGRNNPSYDFIINTMEAYPALSIEWLLTGRGKMYKNTTDEQTLFNFTQDNDNRASNIAISETNEEDNSRKLPQINTSGRVKKIVVFYDDDTYKEFC